MLPLNPLTGSILQTTQVQRTQASEKDRVTRHATELTKNVALEDDRLEHQVESTDTVTIIHDEQTAQDQPKKQHKKHKDEEDDHPSLDLRA